MGKSENSWFFRNYCGLWAPVATHRKQSMLLKPVFKRLLPHVALGAASVGYWSRLSETADVLSVMTPKRMCNSQNRLLWLPGGAIVAANCIVFVPPGACRESAVLDWGCCFGQVIPRWVVLACHQELGFHRFQSFNLSYYSPPRQDCLPHSSIPSNPLNSRRVSSIKA